MSSSPGSTGSANKEGRRGKTRRRHRLCTAMALRPGLVFADVVGSAFCPLTPSRRLHCLLHRRSRPTEGVAHQFLHTAHCAKCARKCHGFDVSRGGHLSARCCQRSKSPFFAPASRIPRLPMRFLAAPRVASLAWFTSANRCRRLAGDALRAQSATVRVAGWEHRFRKQ